MFNFEQLDVWHKSVALADTVYSLTKSFPLDERFGLTNQMRRAAVSISSNIAEGCSRGSTADFGRFIEIAVGSAMELVSQVRIAQAHSLPSATDHDQLYQSTLEIVRMLTGLRDSLKD